MDITKLTEQLQNFFNTHEFQIKPLAGGASARKYFEIDLAKKLYFPSRKILLMSVPLDETRMITDYVHIDFYLNRMNIPTPRIYEMNKHAGWIFLEYQNIPTLRDYLQNNPGKTASLLKILIEFLLHMQDKCEFDDQCPAFQRFFDTEKYQHEFDFHVRQQLLERYFNRKLTKQEIKDFQIFSSKICQTLDINEKVFVHRDFQSSNIFYDGSQQQTPFKLIDFQDARCGSPVYDLVSCLWDSYIEIEDALRIRSLEKFYQPLTDRGTSLTQTDFYKLVDYSVIQRKLHDAGAFAYNYLRFKDKKFVQFISPAIRMALDKMNRYSQFKPVIKIFKTVGDSDD